MTACAAKRDDATQKPEVTVLIPNYKTPDIVGVALGVKGLPVASTNTFFGFPMFAIAILDRYREKFLARYFPSFYITFVVSFFFLSTKWNRNIYYLLVFVPFLLFARRDVFKTLIRSKVLILALIYCLYMLLSQGWAANLGIGQAVDSARRALLVSVFLASTIFVFTNDRIQLNSLFRLVSWTAGLTAIASLTWFGYIQPVHRLVGIGALNSPIIAGGAYAAAALMGYGYFLSGGELNVREKLLSILPILAAIVFVILTKSRGPLLALLAVMVLSTILARPRHIPWILGYIGLPVAFVLSAQRFTFAELLERGDSYRLTIWRQSIEIIRQHPWFGYGFGGERPEILYEFGPIAHSHNLFLSNMVDGGACAFLLLVSLLTMATFWAIRCFRDEGNIALLSLVVFSVMTNLTDGKTLIVSPNYQWLYFWLPIALAAAYEIRCKSTGKTDFLADKQMPERMNEC